MLNSGDKVAILAGAGALHARTELLELAELLGAPIVKTLPGKACVPDDSPYTTGGIGLLGTRPSENVMAQIDTLFMVGTNFPYTKHLPEPGKVRTVQIEVDPARAGNRMPTEAPVIGDAKEGLRALLPMLKRKDDRSFLQGIQARHGQVARGHGVAGERRPRSDRPAVPHVRHRRRGRLRRDPHLRLGHHRDLGCAALDDQGRPGVLPVGQPGHHGARRALRDRRPARLPGRQVIAFVGDGGFAMLMAEFLTAARHQLPVKVFINNNGSYGQILWEQMVLGYPEFGVRHTSFANFAPWATACGGVRGQGHQGRASCGLPYATHWPIPARRWSTSTSTPMSRRCPARSRFSQAKGFTEAFAHGQPYKGDIVKTLVADTVEKLRS